MKRLNVIDALAEAETDMFSDMSHGDTIDLIINGMTGLKDLDDNELVTMYLDFYDEEIEIED